MKTSHSFVLAGALLGALALTVVVFRMQARLRDTLLRTDPDVLRALLDAEENELWPTRPEIVPALERWLGDVDELLRRLSDHENRLASAATRPLTTDEIESERRRLERSLEYRRWQRQRLRADLAELATEPPSGAARRGREIETELERCEAQITALENDLESLATTARRFVDPRDATRAAHVARLEELLDPAPRVSALARVRQRLEFARSVRRRTIDEQRDAWERAVASISDPERCPRYGGLVIRPQTGLVPLGPDPNSGLWEFGHLESGDIPVRGSDGSLEMREGTGIVLVLCPAGEFDMGAVVPRDDEEGELPNVDPWATPDEEPVHRISLGPFFISKYEMTQGQWRRVTGDNPSYHGPEPAADRSLANPVEGIGWDEATTVLRRLGLVLPTEARWEYAARGGTATVWSTGNERSTLEGHANVADRTAAEAGYRWLSLQEWPEHRDGHIFHAPVGSFEPNPFGLHDVHGNVREWCLDRHDAASYTAPVLPGSGEHVVVDGRLRSSRGGGWRDGPAAARSASRAGRVPGADGGDQGVRPAREIDR